MELVADYILFHHLFRRYFSGRFLLNELLLNILFDGLYNLYRFIYIYLYSKDHMYTYTTAYQNWYDIHLYV